eukprot:5327926-Pleurochrysis_carterae.AAC.1
MDLESSDAEGYLDALLAQNLKPHGFLVHPSSNQAELNASVLVSSSECSECDAEEQDVTVAHVKPHVPAEASKADHPTRRARASA